MAIETNSGDLLLNVADLSVKYTLPDKEVLALDHVNLAVRQNSHTLGVVGESGSGKTTLGMSMKNLIEPPGKIMGGRVEFRGKDVLRMNEADLKGFRWSQVAMVYQSAMNALNPVKRIYDPLQEVIREHTSASKTDARERSFKLLSEVGITQARVYDYPHQMSGGQRQRIIIALSLALSPKLLNADEPTSALDIVVQKQILSLLTREVKEKGLSLIYITHEIAILRDLVQDMAVMYAGEIVEIGQTESVLSRPLHPYTEMLLATLLTMDTSRSVFENQPRGAGPESASGIPANACKYSNRCPYVFDRCHVERPRLSDAEKGRFVACHKFS